MRLLNLVLNLILVSALLFFFNSEYPEPETAQTVLSLSPFFRWGCYFRRNWRLWFWRGLFGDFEYFFLFFFFSFEGRPTYWSLCFFLYVLTWIPGEMNARGRKISWKRHITPYFFQNVNEDFPSDTNSLLLFLGKKEMKTQCYRDTERKIAFHASEKQTEVCLNLSSLAPSIHSPGSSSSETFGCCRCIVYFKSTKRLCLASRPSYKSMLLKNTLQSRSAE